MSWFKKLLSGKRENQNKRRIISNTSKMCKNCGKHHQERNQRRRSCYDCDIIYQSTSTSNPDVLIVDPEEFFDDPVHVRMYRDERDFLEIMSEWVIIEDPKHSIVEENFFSADFESELINIKRSTSEQSVVSCAEDQFKIYEKHSVPKKFPYDDECYKILWGHSIRTGSPVVPHDPHKTSNLTKRKFSSADNICRKSTRSKAYKRSIMSAIKDMPMASCDNDEEEISHDPINVEQLFGLSDNGDIVINISHVSEEKGFGFLMCRTRKLYRSITTGREISENFVLKRSVFDFIKNLCKCFFGHPRNKSQPGGPGDTIRSYTLLLANDHTSTFSRNIENFIACTKESREAAPQVVMRNMRQFMSGMKNYLVKHGEGEFHQEVLKARSRLKPDEFLNLDAILETVMHQLVVLPLREHLYGMFVDYYTRSGDIQLLVENVKYACARSPTEFGIRPNVAPPSSIALTQISVLLLKLQEAELPLEKLELFLWIITSIFDATGCTRGQQLGADDFLPILVYVVAKCGFVGAEIEAEFMWGLLQPPLLSGEAGYYLTALCSAVHVLKSFMASDSDGTGSLDWRSSSLPACSSVLRVIIPDECNGSLQTRTLPVRPHTTTRDVCRIIALKARITNPQDYGLFKLVDGEETILGESECPQDARIAARGKHCMLAYKRIDAKIAWPTATATTFQ